MVRRSTPQRDVDDRAFPVRLFVVVPDYGFGRLFDKIQDWLDGEVGRGEYAWHSGGAHGWKSRSALYFRHPAQAAALLAAIPELEISDGTLERSYTSPTFPFGRQAEGE
jgi:hypothetical protein